MAIETIAIALVMAVIYTLLGVAKSAGEDINPTKAGASIGLGVLIGVCMYASGLPITEANVGVQLGIYGSLLYVFENIIKTIVRRWKGPLE
jgi:hypothetical protein